MNAVTIPTPAVLLSRACQLSPRCAVLTALLQLHPTHLFFLTELFLTMSLPSALSSAAAGQHQQHKHTHSDSHISHLYPGIAPLLLSAPTGQQPMRPLLQANCTAAD